MNAFYEGIAEIFEVDPGTISADFDLEAAGWDSLAIVSVIALADDCFNVMLDGQSLARCARVGDIEALVSAQK